MVTDKKRPSHSPVTHIWMTIPWYIRLSFILLALIVIGATAGYMIIEGWSFTDALFMTLITLTTIGYGEVHPLSQRGEWFTVGFITVSFIIYIYAVSALGSYLLSGDFRRRLAEYRIRRRVQKMRDHVIVCGFGRIGAQVVQELQRASVPFVIVDKNTQLVEELHDRGYRVVPGDATQEDVLLEAGILKAKSLVASAATDADNAFITLTARALNPEIFIVARVSEPALEAQMIRAGANRAISPYRIGAVRMAELLSRPHVYEFIEIATGRGSLELRMEEVPVESGSPFAGMSIAQCDIRRQFGVLVVGLTRGDRRTVVFNPDPDTVLEPGYILIALGRAEQLERLRMAMRGETD